MEAGYILVSTRGGLTTNLQGEDVRHEAIGMEVLCVASEI
jgi:hypothetical protein